MIRNTLYIFFGRISNALFLFLLSLAVSRQLGPALFGVYAFLGTVIQTAIHVAGFGLNTLMVREVAKDHNLGKLYLSNILGLKGLTSLATILLGLALFAFSPLAPETKSLLFVFSFSLIFLSWSQTLWFYCNPFDRFDQHSFLWATNNALKSVFGIICVFWFANLPAVIYALLAAEAVSFLFACRSIKNNFGGFRFSYDPALWRQLLKDSAPLALTSILSVYYLQSQIILLKLLSEDQSVGWYTASYRLFELFTMAASVLVMVLFPTLARDYRSAPGRFRLTLKKHLALICGLGAVSAAVLFYSADWMIPFFYGEAFRPAVPAMSILAGCLLFSIPNFLLAGVLIATGREKLQNWNLVLGVAINLGLNLTLIPQYRHLGPAWANLFSEFVLMVILAVQVRSVLKSSARHQPPLPLGAL
jgi:O-antigen/teichoic acid export membrane protein